MWQDTLKEVIRNRRVILGAVSVTSFAAGSASGYFLVKSRVEAQFNARLDEELDKAKAFYADVNKVHVQPEDLTKDYAGGLSTVVEGEPLRDETVEITRTMRYHTQVSEAPVPEEADLGGAVEDIVEEAVAEARNVFASSGDAVAFDYEREVENRSPERAYIITHDEFMDGAMEFEQGSLTFYEGDQTLCDAKDDVIPDVEGVIGGLGNLSFGYGSMDPSIVYIRNERIEMEFSVVRSDESFVESVLGMEEPEIRHGNLRPQIRKFRDADE